MTFLTFIMQLHTHIIIWDITSCRVLKHVKLAEMRRVQNKLMYRLQLRKVSAIIFCYIMMIILNCHLGDQFVQILLFILSCFQYNIVSTLHYFFWNYITFHNQLFSIELAVKFIVKKVITLFALSSAILGDFMYMYMENYIYMFPNIPYCYMDRSNVFA